MWTKIKQLFGCSNTPKVDDEGYVLVDDEPNFKRWELETNTGSVDQLEDFYIRPSRYVLPSNWTSPMQELANLFLRDPSGWVEVSKTRKVLIKTGRLGQEARYDGYRYVENTSYIHLNTGVYLSTSYTDVKFEGRRTTYSSNTGCTERELVWVYDFVCSTVHNVRVKKSGVEDKRASNNKRRKTTKKINDYLKTL